MKFIEKHHRKICILLCVSILTCCTYQSFKQPEEVKAAIVIDDVALLVMAVMAVCGVGYLGATQNDIDNWDWGNQWVGNNDRAAYANEIAQTEELLKKWYENAYSMTGGTGGSEEDPENKPPSLWETLKRIIIQNPTTSLALTGTTLGSIMLVVAKQANANIQGGKYFNDYQLENTPQYTLNTIMNNIDTYPYFMTMYNAETGEFEYCVMTTEIPFVYKNTDGGYEAYYERRIHVSRNSTSKYSNSAHTTYSDCFIYANYEIYESYDEAVESENQIIYPGTLNPANTIEYTGLEKNDNGNVVALPITSFRLPTQEEANTYLDNLEIAYNNQDETALQNAVDTFINAIGQPLSDSDTDTDTDSGTDTDTDTDTKGETELELENSLSEEEKSLFKLPESIIGKFPFCIPFDMIEAFSILEDTERKAPAFTVPLKVDRYNFYHEIDVDLSMFDEVAELMRTMELILFIIGLGFSTKTLMKG